jgi:nucleoside-diphosphate-sugar epimerase
MKRVGIIGCGWLGAPLFQKMAAQNRMVFGTVRQLTSCSDDGLFEWTADETMTDDLSKLIRQADALIVTIPPQKQLELAENVSFHQRLARTLSQENEHAHLIYTSSTSVYGDHQGDCLERHADSSTRAFGIEKAYHTFFENTSIMRFGGLIGPHRNPSQFFKSGRPIPEPEAWANLTHQDDAIDSILHVLRLGSPGVFNVVSPEHVSRRTLYTEAFLRNGLGQPTFEDEATIGKKVMSDKIINLLGYTFVRPSALDCL